VSSMAAKSCASAVQLNAPSGDKQLILRGGEVNSVAGVGTG
jgi:hypothetical protein